MVNYSSGGDSDAVKLGLVAEPFQLETVNSVGLGATSGVIIASLVRPAKPGVSNLGLWVGTVGGTSTGKTSMAIYTEAGVKLAETADMTAALTNAANNGMYVEAAASATVSTSANYYVALLCQLTTNPLIGGQFVGAGVTMPTVKTHRASLTLTGQTALPATLNIAGMNNANAAYWLVAS